MARPAAMAATVGAGLMGTAFIAGSGRNTPSISARLTEAQAEKMADQRFSEATAYASSSTGAAPQLFGLALLGVSAAALKRQRKTTGSRSAVRLRAFESELGVQAPVGYWDPLGLAQDGDAALFARRRETEIKHGRLSMLATMGYITPELTGKFPGYLSPSQELSFEDIPNGLGALSKVPVAGWLQIFAYCLFVEAPPAFKGIRGAEPGDLGFKPPLLTSSDPDLRQKRLNVELANGRLAMMAIIGMFFQDGLTGSAWGDWALYTDSPMRAAKEDKEAAPPPPPPFDPAKQIGAMAPLGFFDPAGFSKVGDEEGFRNLRSAEIKHGRVAMMAALGGVAQHYIKFPGFDGVPAGFKAAITPPGLYGFVLLFLVSGGLELAVWTQDPKKEPGNFGDPVGLGMYDDEMRAKEINNGRFAMFAALGIISADLLTGKDAIQQFSV